MSASGLHIREATRRDDEFLAAIIRHGFRDVADRFNLTPQNCPTHPSNCTRQWIESAMAKGTVYYVAEEGGEPCGCVALEHAEPDVCYLERLAVSPHHRRLGIGTALVCHVLSQSRRMKVRRVELAIIAQHAELREWYEKLGFVKMYTRSFDHLPFDVTFMSRDL